MNLLHRIRVGLLVLAVVMVVGTAGYVVIEDAPALDALYMVLITITTVGFGDVIELSQVGRVWTIAVLVVGFGVSLYTAAASIEYVIELSSVRIRKRMEDRVAKLRGHTIVCGFGRVGQGTWKTLRARGVDVAVIESDADRAAAAEAAGALVITGDATHNSVLELAGIHSAEALIACVADDSDNLVIALSTKALRPGLRVVCRASETESERKLRLAGADAVVAPQVVGAERLALLALQPELAQIFDVVVGGSPVELHVEELEIAPDCRVAGKSIEESCIREECGAMIVAVEEADNGLDVNPNPDTPLRVGDRVVVVGTRERVAAAAKFVSSGS
ncbi:MAG TPA: potassium channel protein [Acidimicrobiia bacterium]|nr:potassium channel protein [Acidimicrobiia bacterium]